MTPRATVFVVDDNLRMRRSLQELMESTGLAAETYASGEEFLAAYDPERAGCLLLDVCLRGSNGLDLQDELRRRKAILPIIFLTGHASVPTSVRALKAGALDFLQKPIVPATLMERIHAAIDIDRRSRAVAAQHATRSTHLARLTPREREVMELLITGNTSNEIAAVLRISVRTVEVHRRTLFWKMNVSSAAQLVRTVLGACEADRNAA